MRIVLRVITLRHTERPRLHTHSISARRDTLLHFLELTAPLTSTALTDQVTSSPGVLGMAGMAGLRMTIWSTVLGLIEALRLYKWLMTYIIKEA